MTKKEVSSLTKNTYNCLKLSKDKTTRFHALSIPGTHAHTHSFLQR